MDFAVKTKKVAYATSMGAVRIFTQGKEVANHYTKLLDDFSAISVRENSAKKWISELTKNMVTITADPTLLIAKVNLIN